MAYLSKAEILAADDLPMESVEVPEWGGLVLVRGMSGLERDGISQGLRQADGKMDLEKFRTSVCACSMVDEQGKRLFSDAEVEALGAKSTTALDRVYEVASRLSGLGAETNEDLEKNSGKTRSGRSGSN